MIWQEMFGNGVRIGMGRITTVTPRLRTRLGQAQAHTGCCGAGLGTAVLTTCGWLTATAAIRIIGTPATDFDVCQDRLNYP